MLLNTQSVMPVQGVMQYKGRIPVSGIESVELRRGVVGVPYVSVTLTDGAEVQLRAGVAGSKCALLVQEIEAAIARSDAG